MMAIQKLEDDRCWLWLAASFQTTFCRKGRLKTGLELARFIVVQCWILKPVQIAAHFKVFRSLLISRQEFAMCIKNGSTFPDLSQLRRARSLYLVTQSTIWDSLWQWNLHQSEKVNELLPNLSWDDLAKFKALFSSVLTWIRQNNISSSSPSLQQN